MLKSKPIIIEIPTPCAQNWDEMIQNNQGRFCNQCSKTVIDFTTWTDAQLYKFFSKNTGHLCGRYLATQLDRNIAIPYQPHSRLYRLAIAMGLTLLFTQIPQSHAQKYSPGISQTQTIKDTTLKPGYGSISGRVLDDKKEPLPSAVVQIFQDKILKGGAMTDLDGNFVINDIETGKYDALVLYAGLDSLEQKSIEIFPTQKTSVNFQMRHKAGPLRNIIILGGRKPLVDIERPQNDKLQKIEIDYKPIDRRIIVNKDTASPDSVKTSPNILGTKVRAAYSKPLIDIDNPGQTIFTKNEIDNMPGH